MFNKNGKPSISVITEVPELLNKSYYGNLDGLRGIAILFVILSHIFLTTIYSEYVNGGCGVEIFFVLSGFLITTLLLKEKVKKRTVSFKDFYIRRILRIVPVAYLFLTVLILLNYIFKLKVSTLDFLGAFLYIRNLPLHFSDWYSGHFWTLAIEEQFYLIFPWLLILNTNTYLKVICILIIFIPILQYLDYNHVSVFYTNYIIHKITILIVSLFTGGTLSILIGSLLSVLIFKGVKVRIVGNYYLSFIFLLIAIILRTVLGRYTNEQMIISILFAIIIAYVIFLSLPEADFLSLMLKNKILIKVGILSYSIYIWQQLFTLNQPWKGLFKYSDSLFLNIPALFIVAYLSYHFYELKFLKLKEKFKSVGHNIDNKTL